MQITPLGQRATFHILPRAGRKWCPACCQNLDVEAFGFDRGRADGLSGWCRGCRATAEKARRDSDLEAVRAELRARYRRDPAKHFALVAVKRALARGRLSKPDSCPVCFRFRLIEAHHHAGYARENWLNVAWRCRQCHALEHKRGPAIAEVA